VTKDIALLWVVLHRRRILAHLVIIAQHSHSRHYVQQATFAQQAQRRRHFQVVLPLTHHLHVRLAPLLLVVRPLHKRRRVLHAPLVIVLPRAVSRLHQINAVQAIIVPLLPVERNKQHALRATGVA
jgi:hypothetical protein